MKDSETQGEEQSLSPDDERLIKTGLKVFKNIATKWSMTLEQQSALLGCDDRDSVTVRPTHLPAAS